MQDEERAELLASALSGDESLPDSLDDEELVALAALGAELSRRGPEMALLSQADDAFDPAFATRLRGTLLAAHPEAPAGAVAQARRAGPASRPLRRRGVFRVLVALAVLAIVALAVLLTSVVQNMQLGFQTSRAAPTATPAPAPLAGLQSGGVGAAGTARSLTPRPVESAPLATPPPPATAVASTPPRPQVFAPQQRVVPKPTPPLHAAAAPSMPAAAQPALKPADAAVPPRPAQAPEAAVLSLSVGPITYRLPSAVPPIPGTAALYTVQPVQLSAPAVTGIAALFPGLHGVAGPPGVRAFTDGRQRLVILPATGQVDYTAPAAQGGARGGAISSETAILAAHGWLALHGLYPNGVDERATVVRRIGLLTSVRFLPAVGLPLSGADAAISLIVDLDSTGRVISAHRLWPNLRLAGSAPLLSPAAALQRGRASVPAGGAGGAGAIPPSGTFTVQGVRLAYAPSTTAGGGTRLMPVYVLSGSLQGPTGPARAFAQTVPAAVSGG